MFLNRRIYFRKHFPLCHFHARPATFWALSVDDAGYIHRVTALCEPCSKGYEDLMEKTYGKALP